MDPELTPEQLAQARREAADAKKKGFSAEEIGEYLKEEYGVGLKDIQPKARDYLRAAFPFGFGDEAAGIAAVLPLRGQFGRTTADYRPAKEATLESAEAARGFAPKRMLAAEVVGSAIPAMATMGGSAAVQGGGALAKALAAGESGFGLGLLSGLGHTEAESLGGMIDEAGKSALLTAGAGAAGSLLGSGGGLLLDRLMPSRVVAREAGELLPGNVAQQIARQNELAPGTALPIDQSQSIVKFARVVGEDREAASRAVGQLSQRVKEIDKARQAVGKRYQAIDRKLPVDPELRDLAGKRLDLLDNEVDFLAVHGLRSEIGRKLRDAQRAYKLTGEKGDVVAELSPVKEGLDNWLRARVPEVAKIDEDYGAVMGMLQRARQAEKVATQSRDAHATLRVSGKEATSPGASMGKRPSIWDILGRAASPSPARRARVVEQMLMRPENTRRAMSLLQPQESMFPELLQSGLLSGTAQLPPYLIGN